MSSLPDTGTCRDGEPDDIVENNFPGCRRPEESGHYSVCINNKEYCSTFGKWISGKHPEQSGWIWFPAFYLGCFIPVVLLDTRFDFCIERHNVFLAEITLGSHRIQECDFFRVIFYCPPGNLTPPDFLMVFYNHIHVFWEGKSHVRHWHHYTYLCVFTYLMWIVGVYPEGRHGCSHRRVREERAGEESVPGLVGWLIICQIGWAFVKSDRELIFQFCKKNRNINGWRCY